MIATWPADTPSIANPPLADSRFTLPCEEQRPQVDRAASGDADWEIRRREICDIAALEPVWKELSSRAEHAYFTSWSWIGTWLEFIVPRRRPQLVEIIRNGQLVGLALLCQRRHLQARAVPVRGWFLHETGHADFDDLTVEHNGIVADRAFAEETHRRFVEYCLRELPGNDSLFLSGVTRETPLDRAAVAVHTDPKFAALTRRWHQPRVAKQRSYYTVDLNRLRRENVDYLALLSSGTRSQIRRSIKAYESEFGPLAIRAARTAGEAQQYFEELIELHNAAWNARGRPGAFADREVLDFHLRKIPRAVMEGNVQLLRITAGEKVLGVLYNFVWQGRVSSYQSGFAFETQNKFKPGLVCHTLAIQQAVQAGESVYDFLAGDHRYKAQLSTEQGEMRWLRFERRTPKMKLLHEGRRVRDVLRGWKARYKRWRAPVAKPDDAVTE